MQILVFIKCLTAVLLPDTALPTVSLSFNPIKVAFLIIWVYLCVYTVRSVQVSLLVPKSFKMPASVIALFAGPILLLVLAAADAVKRYLRGDDNIIEVVKGYLQNYLSIKLFNLSGDELKQVCSNGKNKQQNSQILGLTRQTIAGAIDEHASDIIIEPKGRSTYIIRFRVDGVLWEADQIEADICQAVMNSIKAVSGMDVSEKQTHQDGAFTAKTKSAKVSFRVVSDGSPHGERLSIRALNRDPDLLNLNNIGLSDEQRAIIKNVMAKSSGMILVCGPTGSGKTTTLYAMLNNIDLFTRSVATIEDPIECLLPNVNQIEVNPRGGITFANSLDNILRQDPDMVCIGEIRDKETACIALQAAQKRQLVPAAILSNSTASTLIKLLDLGVPAQMLSAGLNLIISQRLIRRLCSNCKIPAELSQSQIQDLRKRKINHTNIYQPGKCEKCRETGYRGRTAIFDFLVLDDELKASIANNRLPIAQLRKEGDMRGNSNLQIQGLKKVTSGITSLEELKRVVG